MRPKITSKIEILIFRLLKQALKAPKFEKLPPFPSVDDKFEDLQAIFDAKVTSKPYKNYENIIHKAESRENNPTMQELLKYKSW